MEKKAYSSRLIHTYSLLLMTHILGRLTEKMIELAGTTITIIMIIAYTFLIYESIKHEDKKINSED